MTFETRADPFTRLYREHARFVWQSLQRLGVHRADVEDMVQEVFLVAYRRLDSFTGVSQITTWLFGICMRVAANYRRLRRWTAEISLASAGKERATEELPADEALVFREELAAAERVLAGLSIKKRSAFIMFEMEARSCADIARATGASVGTIYSRLHAARRDIRRMSLSNAHPGKK